MTPGKASMIRTKEAGKTPLLPPHSPLRQENIVGLFQSLRADALLIPSEAFTGSDKLKPLAVGDIFARQPPV